jgi:hypothetical protein
MSDRNIAPSLSFKWDGKEGTVTSKLSGDHGSVEAVLLKTKSISSLLDPNAYGIKSVTFTGKDNSGNSLGYTQNLDAPANTAKHTFTVTTNTDNTLWTANVKTNSSWDIMESSVKAIVTDDNNKTASGEVTFVGGKPFEASFSSTAPISGGLVNVTAKMNGKEGFKEGSIGVTLPNSGIVTSPDGGPLKSDAPGTFNVSALFDPDGFDKIKVAAQLPNGGGKAEAVLPAPSNGTEPAAPVDAASSGFSIGNLIGNIINTTDTIFSGIGKVGTVDDVVNSVIDDIIDSSQSAEPVSVDAASSGFNIGNLIGGIVDTTDTIFSGIGKVGTVDDVVDSVIDDIVNASQSTEPISVDVASSDFDAENLIGNVIDTTDAVSSATGEAGTVDGIVDFEISDNVLDISAPSFNESSSGTADFISDIFSGGGVDDILDSILPSYDGNSSSYLPSSSSDNFDLSGGSDSFSFTSDFDLPMSVDFSDSISSSSDFSLSGGYDSLGSSSYDSIADNSYGSSNDLLGSSSYSSSDNLLGGGSYDSSYDFLNGSSYDSSYDFLNGSSYDSSYDFLGSSSYDSFGSSSYDSFGNSSYDSFGGSSYDSFGSSSYDFFGSYGYGGW